MMNDLPYDMHAVVVGELGAQIGAGGINVFYRFKDLGCYPCD